MFQTLCNGLVTPLKDLRLVFNGAFNGLSKFEQSLCRIVPTVEKHILDVGHQFFIYFLVNFKHRWVHNPHTHSVLNSVVQERSMHGLSNRIISAEAEAHVTHPTTYFGVRKVFTNPFGSTEKVQCV